MKGIPQGRYSKEFRQEAVKLVLQEGLSWAAAARRLSLPTSTLANWVKAAKAGKLGDVGKNYRPLTEVEMELARTKKELAEVKMERDILKKAAAYFARESGSRCTVCGNETDATQLPSPAYQPDFEGVNQRFLCLAR